jgi:poly(glycerol-phosphate) alpha-glucosyltransferase
MKIAFLTPSVSRAIGGIFEIERRLGQTLADMPGLKVSVYGLKDEHTVEDLALWQPLAPKVYPVSGPRAFGYSAHLNEAFLQEDADAAHLHSLWMFTSLVVYRWGQSKRRPYVVTPNGMLEPWALGNSAWKKRLAAILYERVMLRDAACLQANSEKEAADFRAYRLKNHICIIPNGIDLPVRMENETTRQHGTVSGKPIPEANKQNPVVHALKSEGRKVLLYVGRLHPKKGLVNLLRAWAQVQGAAAGGLAGEWILAIAGWDQRGHETELKRLAGELGICFADVRNRKSEAGAENRNDFQLSPPCEIAPDFSQGGGPSSVIRRPSSVLFLGPQFGGAKAACYANCDAFILPSVSEGLPMAILEAWACGKPVLMTPECNLPEGFAANAAIGIEPTVEGIVRGLLDLLRHPPSALRAMGANGRALVAGKFTWPKIAAEMESVYKWVLGGGSKPGCIV